MAFVRRSITGMIHTVKLDTIVTTKGTTTIPEPYRQELGISTGTIMSWEVRGGKLVGVKKAGAENALQAHIRKYSGAWKGSSKVLRRTRGREV
jgi:bifunctional DNA-binding transcriptional regulator/antitoxin component of YhaV-PrlF toxin-antitoxin module